MRPFHFLICLSFALLASNAYATSESRPLKMDHRVQTIVYQPDQVYKYVGHYRYQSSIEFAEDEEIRTISMGDTTAWMINPAGNRLFLKPIEQDATTNMTLLTNKHTYLFELHARDTDDIDDAEMVFILRFIYPGEGNGGDLSGAGFLDNVPDPSEDTTGKYNFSYSISGSDLIAPIKIFDDGEFTYFQFQDKNAEVPAFFLVDKDGNESLINFRTRGDYIVVERVAKNFTLRRGNDIVCVFNDGRVTGQGMSNVRK
jgi:type IV secretion system protein VirB9